MTTAHIHGKAPQATDKFRLPDPPEHPDDKMTSSKHLESWPETDRIMARGYTPGNQG